MTTEQKLQVDLDIILPGMDSADECVQILTDRLGQHRGVEKAHVIHENGDAQLCLHFDPNFISLSDVKRVAKESGAEVADRYRHEQLPFSGLNTADSAQSLQRSLEQQTGVLHASVNYAAGLIFIAYDTEQIQRSSIQQVIQTGLYPFLSRKGHNGSKKKFQPFS